MSWPKGFRMLRMPLLLAVMLPLWIGGCGTAPVYKIPDAELGASMDCIMHADTAAPLYPLRWTAAPYATYCPRITADVDAKIAARKQAEADAEAAEVIAAGRVLP